MRPLPKWIQDLGNTTDGLFIVDRCQRVALWNQGAEKLLGYSERDVLGRACHEVIAGKTRAGKLWCRADCAVQQSLKKGKPHTAFGLNVRDKAGRERRTHVNIIALTNQSRPLTVHLIQDAQHQQRDKEAVDRILDTLRTAGYLDTEGERTPQHRDASGRPDESVSTLTPREVEILSLVAQGSSTKAIARDLNLSTYTVRNHVQNALQKLGLHTKAQAVSYAYRNGLI